METHHCWVCDGDFAGPALREGGGGNYVIDCTTCGRYKITPTQSACAFPLPDSERYRFSFWCKQRTLDGREPPLLHSYSVKDIVAALPNPDPSEKADLFLASLAKLHPFPGEEFTIDTLREYSLACARNRKELSFHLITLLDAGLIVRLPTTTGHYHILGKGWLRARELRELPIASRTAFVALRFNDEMLGLYESAFAPAIVAAGFEAQRSGDPTHNEKIDAEIIVQLKRSRFVVADSTFANPGVYFEAGYALAARLPVIWTCRDDRHKEDVHFDTRQYNHILWKDGEDLKKQLTARIVATI